MVNVQHMAQQSDINDMLGTMHEQKISNLP